MPIKRYADYLLQRGELESYMQVRVASSLLIQQAAPAVHGHLQSSPVRHL